MRHTLLVHRLHLALSIGLLLGLGLSFQSERGAAQEPPLLDLTLPGPKQEGPLSAPGGRAGGVSHGGGIQGPRPYSVPLRVEIIGIQPRAVGRNDRFLIEVELTNTGSTAFLLPVSRDWVGVLQKAGHQERRWAGLNVHFDERDHPSDAWGSIATLVGSPSVPDSLLQLEPGRSIRVRTYGHFRVSGRWYPSPEQEEVTVRLGYKESILEDEEYMIANSSEEVFSTNSVTLRLSE